MSVYSLEVGILGVVISILFFGSFGVPVKLPHIQRAKVDPMVMQLYYSLGIFFSSFIILGFVPFQFSWLGICSALLWVPSSALLIQGINLIGLSVAQATICGVTMVVSFMWGTIGFNGTVKNIWVSILGLLLLKIGIFGVSTTSDNEEFSSKNSIEGKKQEKMNKYSLLNNKNVNEHTSQPFLQLEEEYDDNENEDEEIEIQNDGETELDTKQTNQQPEEEEGIKTQILKTLNNDKIIDNNDDNNHDDDDNYEEEELIVEKYENYEQKIQDYKENNSDSKFIKFLKYIYQKFRNPIIGVIFSLLAGIMNGSMMVPLKYAHVKSVGFAFSFGVGVIIVTPIIFIFYSLINLKIPDMKVREALLPGLIGGLIWNVGNVGSIMATLSPLGYTVGFPLTQLCLVISSLYGIAIFKEVRGWRRFIQFLISCFVFILLGAALLSYFGLSS